MEPTVMETFMTSLGAIVTAGFGFVSQGATTVIANPVLFIGLGFGIVVGLVKMIKK